ncbi:MAG: 16S rRNA (guanine(966)-N(2))-methyltransferase RsmD [Lachnospiraceae bacterium]|jgi:16S rRNA (guanine966-N2)-methyltransferase|nr:16S rRNA (guanine(966)-N(2))-methyltransferase RsmD [Lachnospiraceae bacterium]
MRVIAGTARSLPLKAPQGLEVRPTTDKIRETLFNMLQWDIPGSVFVDLFSGSGAVGIEALSRGAGKAYFVDKSPRAISCIQQNLSFTKTADRAIVIKQDACIALESIGRRAGQEKADFIFLDPPYDCGLEREVLRVLNHVALAAENTVIIVEASMGTDFSYVSDLGFSVIREKKYKTNKHLFLKKGNLS